jgi:hypothetical protein
MNNFDTLKDIARFLEWLETGEAAGYISREQTIDLCKLTNARLVDCIPLMRLA